MRSQGFLVWLALICGILASTPPELAGQTSIRTQWEASPHARSMDTPDERARMNSPGCARCHTAQGYHREILGRGESAAPYGDAAGITCQACHTIGEAGGFGPRRPDPEQPGDSVPRFPADPSLTPIQARASHNYRLVEKDGSLGVHNPVYTRALLEASVAEARKAGLEESSPRV
jgi:hypothetical protein